MIRFIASAALLGLVVVAAGACTANQVCAQRQECNDSLEDDSQAVCVESYNATIDSLRANAEEECHRLADAILARDNCLLQLDCNDLDDPDDVEEACGDQFDDVRDAQDDADDECSSFE